MRFHLVALPGQPVTKENSTCAFTQKIRKFADMMVPRGHEVFIYGDPRHDESLATEYIGCYEECEPPLFTQEEWLPFNIAAQKEIKERYQPGDILGLFGGYCQSYLATVFPELFAVEIGIGHGGSFSPYRIFESYAWMHIVYGNEQGQNDADGAFYDAVIPGYFNKEEHIFIDNTQNCRNSYLFYIGRLEERKGIRVAEETAKELGVDLLIAGKGPYEPSYGELIGVVGPDERSKLIGSARAVLMPTTYVEPFGFVAIESMLGGTPVITTDWGAFAETNKHGVSGYRCRTKAEFVEAVKLSDKLNKKQIRKYAEDNFSYEVIAPKYEAYVDQLNTLYGEGWFSKSLPRGFKTRYS
jgi:glycosyltransferase involved in cell wall biosynthesis